MFEYKNMSKNELEQVIKNASLKIGVNEVILEKDYLMGIYQIRIVFWKQCTFTVKTTPDIYRN